MYLQFIITHFKSYFRQLFNFFFFLIIYFLWSRAGLTWKFWLQKNPAPELCLQHP